LLQDDDLDHHAAWALGESGSERAILPLIAVLNHADAPVRVSSIHALAKLRAAEALPHLETLLTDTAVPYAASPFSVGYAAKVAIETIQRVEGTDR
jgi:HEAT repeat protein